MRLFVSMILLVSANLFATRPHAEETPSKEPGETWSLGATAHISPLEDYPKGGFSLDAAYNVLPRLSLGGRLTYCFPRGYANVVRNAGLAEVLLRALVVDTDHLDWTVGLGVGVGFFHDDFEKVYDDVTRLAPGFTLDTTLEVRLTAKLRPFIGVASVMYFPDEITDSQWLEIVAGVRFHF